MLGISSTVDISAVTASSILSLSTLKLLGLADRNGSPVAYLRWQVRRHHGHCSAVVQLAPDMKDLWVAHATWDEYRGSGCQIDHLALEHPGHVAHEAYLDVYSIWGH